MSITQRVHKISLKVDAQTRQLDTVVSQFKSLENEIRATTSKFDTLTSHMRVMQNQMQRSMLSNAKASKKAYGSMANDIVRHIRRLESMLVGFYALKKAYDVTIGMGHEFNKMMESEKIGMALIISGRLKHVNVLGQEVTAMDRWIYANNMAKDVMEDVREINVSTPHTLEQTTQIYKTMAGQILAYGGNLEQVKNATKDVSIVSKAMNVDFGQLLKTVDALYSGKMKDSDLKRALQNSVGMDFDKIKELAKTDKEGAVKYVNEMLAKAKIASKAIEKSWGGVTSNFINAWTDIQAELQKPLFDSMKEEIQNAGEYLKEHKDEIVGFITGVKDAIKETLPLIGKLATAYGVLRGSMMLGAGIKSMRNLRKASNLARLGVIGVIGAFVATRNDVSSFGTAIQKLGDYFEVGFEAINFMVSATMESMVGWFNYATSKAGLYWDQLVAEIILTKDILKKGVIDLLNNGIIEPFNKGLFKAKKLWNDFMGFLGLESDKPVLNTSNLISTDGMDAEIQKSKAKLDEIRKDIDKPLAKTDLENDIASYRAEANLKLLDAIDKANGTAVANSKKTIEEVKKQVDDATKIDFAPAIKGDDEDDSKARREKERLLKGELDAMREKHKQLMLIAKIEGGVNGLSKIKERQLKIKFLKEEIDLQAKLTAKAGKDSLANPNSTKLKAQYEKEVTKQLDLQLKLMKAQETTMDKLFANFKDSLSDFSSAFADGGIQGLGDSLANYANNAIDTMKNSGEPIMMALGYGADILKGLFGGDQTEPPPVLDDMAKTSDSMANALSHIEDAQYPMLQLTRDMRGYLSIIANSFGAIENSLLRSDIDFAGTYYKEQEKAGLFSSKSYSLHGTSLQFGGATISDILAEGLRVTREEVIKKVYDSAWKTKTTYFHNKYNVSNLFAEDIANATKAMFDGFGAIGAEIGVSMDGLLDEVIRIGKIDTTGKSSQQIAEEIEARFSAQTDAIAEKYLGVVAEFQRAGEGLAETAFRVAMTFEQVGHSMELIGKSVDWRTANIIEQVAGGLDMFNASMSSYQENFFTDAERYEMKLNTMTKSFASLGLAVPDSKESFRSLVESIDTTSDAGAVLFAEVISLADGFAEMTSSAKSLGEVVSSITDAWLGNLSYLTLQQKADLASATFALSRESNGTIDPVDSARAMAETALKTVATKEEYIPIFNQYIQTLKDQAPKATTDDVVARLDVLIDRVVDLETTTRQTA